VIFYRTTPDRPALPVKSNLIRRIDGMLLVRCMSSQSRRLVLGSKAMGIYEISVAFHILDYANCPFDETNLLVVRSLAIYFEGGHASRD
jgi:hypothetical protein